MAVFDLIYFSLASFLLFQGGLKICSLINVFIELASITIVNAFYAVD